MQLQTSRQSIQTFVLGLGTAAIIVAAFIGLRVSAATPTPSPTVNPTTASGLQISPATIDLSGAKGKTYNINLKLQNVTDNTLSYVSSVDDFGAKDETGTAKLLPKGDLPPTASMISWVRPIDTVTLQAHEIRQIGITIVIPSNAEAGGHYGVVNFTSTDPTVSGDAVGVRASTGLLILATVAGAINEDLSVASLTTTQNGNQNSFFETGPITFVSRLQNKGNVHLKPTGTIEVADMFGGITDILKVNNPPSNVLPSSIRRFETTLNKDWMFGRYTATLTVGYGTTGQVATQQITFWVIPYKLLLTVLLVLVTLGFIARQMLKGYNRRVISKYKQSNDKTTKKSKKHKS